MWMCSRAIHRMSEMWSWFLFLTAAYSNSSLIKIWSRFTFSDSGFENHNCRCSTTVLKQSEQIIISTKLGNVFFFFGQLMRKFHAWEMDISSSYFLFVFVHSLWIRLLSQKPHPRNIYFLFVWASVNLLMHWEPLFFFIMHRCY